MNTIPARHTLTLQFWLLVAIVVLLLISYTAFGSTRFSNDARLHALAQTVMMYPRPPHTELLDQHTQFGALVGLHDHCDFAVRQTLSTRLSRAEIASFYQNATVPSVHMPSRTVPLVLTFDRRLAPDGRIRYTLLAMERQAKGLELRCN